jgi:hypothetical protein
MSNTSTYLSCKETAKLARTALKKAFAGVKFSVRSDNKNLIALADSFMAIFGFKRLAIISGNIITPAAFETDSCTKSANNPIILERNGK